MEMDNNGQMGHMHDHGHMEEKMGGMCRCPHHKMVPGLVFLFGVLFLLFNLGVLSASFTNIAWPILVILAGWMKWSGGMCKCYGM